MKVDTLFDKLQRLVEYAQQFLRDSLQNHEPCYGYIDKEVCPEAKHSKIFSRYVIPKDFHIVGNMQITTPDACKVKVVIDENVVWTSVTVPNEPLKVPFTLNMRRLADHHTSIVVHGDGHLRILGRKFQHPDDRDRICSYLLRGQPWFEAKTPREWE